MMFLLSFSNKSLEKQKIIFYYHILYVFRKKSVYLHKHLITKSPILNISPFFIFGKQS